MAEQSWEHATDEHHLLHNILVNVATRAHGLHGATGKAVDAASAALDKSVGHHEAGDYRSAHNQLQIAAEQIGTAAALGNYHDKMYGMSMHPKDAAEGEVISYKHGYFS